MTLPDIEATLTTLLRADVAVAAIVGTRVYTEVPNNPTWPLVRLMRASGQPFTRGRWGDEARIELGAYGGPKATARNLAEACRDALDGARGVHGDAVITWVRFGALSWVPDAAYEPHRPRYLVDFSVRYHPAA